MHGIPLKLLFRLNKVKSKKPNTTAINEKAGIEHPKSIDAKAIAKIKLKRKRQQSTAYLAKKITEGNITALSRAITLIESKNPKHAQQAEQLINICLPKANNSIRVGVTGVPGVGKSTFIEALGNLITTQNKKVAILAVDPSSTISGGSILGDKTRMNTLVKNKNAFIRPSASGNSLGGVAQKTRETIILCEAAGFDVIIIETVGVGQSETAVHSMVDFFLLLKLAGAGDELQGIKRGIIEMADAIAINKADGNTLNSAKLARIEFERALHLYPKKESDWSPKVKLVSALKNEGIDTIWQLICDYESLTKNNHFFDKKRNDQNTYWLLQTIENKLKTDFFNKKGIHEALKQQLKQIEALKTTPFAAAKYLMNFKP